MKHVKRTATWSFSDPYGSQRPALPTARRRVIQTADLMVPVENDGKVTRRRLFSVEFLPITIGRGSRRHSKRRGGDRDRPDHGGGTSVSSIACSLRWHA